MLPTLLSCGIDKIVVEAYCSRVLCDKFFHFLFRPFGACPLLLTPPNPPDPNSDNESPLLNPRGGCRSCALRSCSYHFQIPAIRPGRKRTPSLDGYSSHRDRGSLHGCQIQLRAKDRQIRHIQMHGTPWVILVGFRPAGYSHLCRIEWVGCNTCLLLRLIRDEFQIRTTNKFMFQASHFKRAVAMPPFFAAIK